MPTDIPVVVLGGGSVGKSCITIQYIQGHFVDRYDATIEDVYRKSVEVDGAASVLTIVDTAGQEGFAAMREQYMKTGQGFILVYSITDHESLVQLQGIYATLRRNKGTNNVPCVVVGNKLDLDAQREVSKEDGMAFARSANSPFMEISAKDRLSVEDLFTTLVRGIRNDKTSTDTNGGGGGGGARQQAAAPVVAAGAVNGGGQSDGAARHDASRGGPDASQSQEPAKPAPSDKKEKKKKKKGISCIML